MNRPTKVDQLARLNAEIPKGLSSQSIEAIGITVAGNRPLEAKPGK
jgi:hypothetical protein